MHNTIETVKPFINEPVLFYSETKEEDKTILEGREDIQEQVEEAVAPQWTGYQVEVWPQLPSRHRWTGKKQA